MLKAPPTVVSIVPPRGKPERTELKVLDAYVETIRLWSSQPAQADTIRFESTAVGVRPWAARAIHRFCNSPHPTRGEIEDLVTQGVAVIAKCNTDLGAANGNAADLTELYTCQAEMMLDVAVGTVVVRELQQLGNKLLAAGDNENVRELNQFQHDVRKVVQEVRSSLGDSEKARAEQFVDAFQAETPELPATGSPSVPRPPQTAPKTRPRTIRAATRQAEAPLVHVEANAVRPGRFRSYLLGTVFGLMLVRIVGYGVMQFKNAPIQGDASESLTAAVAGVPEVTEVQDRMPYIVVTVRADFWDTSGESQRKDWVRDLSKLSERHGYSGLVVRSTGGTPLAEWVRGRGIKFGPS